MELPNRYEYETTEKKWIEYWKKNKTYKFNVKTKKKIYSIDTPPPFTSGTLHMGHILGFSWIDFIARYKRMNGYEVYLPQGFDCHGLPTEMKVEKEFKINPNDREKFLEKCKEWTLSCIEKMREQFEKIGYSTDWNYEYKTMDKDYNKLVQYSLLNFYKNGWLYREKHPILWCPRCRTALAKAEVGYIEKQGNLYYLDLKIKQGGKITIATTRPEFLPACVAVFVNPNDKKYKGLKGKTIRLPIYEREVPILEDEDVDINFGTGAVYLCTYGDEQDIVWQKKYKLPVYEILTKDGKLQNSGFLDGLKTEDARKKIVEELKKLKMIVKEEKINHNVLCHTERASCSREIELIPQIQWFIKVKEFKNEIIKNSKEYKWYPKKLRIRLVDWAKSMDWDWVISRQRVFGTPIPFWICSKCGKIIEAKESELPVDPAKIEKKCECNGKAIGEKDICDCWIDSSVTPLKISKYKENEELFKKTYPISLRPQGYEIIRTWMFYTLFRCYKITNKVPWKETVINGMVAGTDGRKMSKSFGNVIPPEEVLKKYSADAVRQWALMASLGDDYPFNWKEIDFSSKFLTKLWNIARFTQLITKDYKKGEYTRELTDKWIISKLNDLITKVTKLLENYRFYALRDIRTFIWHDLADNYLEMIKYRIYRKNVKSKRAAQQTLLYVLENCLKLLAPYVPFITEEVHSLVLKNEKSIHLCSWPKSEKKLINKNIEDSGDLLVKMVSALRKYKKSKNLSLKEEIKKIEFFGSEKIKPFIKEIKEVMNVKEIALKKKGSGKNKISGTKISFNVI